MLTSLSITSLQHGGYCIVFRGPTHDLRAADIFITIIPKEENARLCVFLIFTWGVIDWSLFQVTQNFFAGNLGVGIGMNGIEFEA